MPPRPPPSPPVLTVLSIISAGIAGWVAIAIDQAARGVLGSMAGKPFLGLVIAAPTFTVRAVQGAGAAAGPLGRVAELVGGSFVLLLAALVLQALAGGFRLSGWLKSLVLSFHVVGLVWLPTALVAAVLPGGGGPVAELYTSLGNPTAGRWAAAGLGLLMLMVLSGTISRSAVATGRSWMRADGVDFRRRLVRVVAGYPGATWVAAMVVILGWMPPAFASAWAVVILITLVLRTA